MRFRISDEKRWASEFEAHSPDTLRQGVEAARRSWLPAVHPRFRLRTRMSEIARWESERMGRADAPADARRSWAAQAATWRGRAEAEYRRDIGANLRLHVLGPRSGTWLSADNRLPAPRIGERVSAAEAATWFERAVNVARVDREIAELGHWLAGDSRQRPQLVRVK